MGIRKTEIDRRGGAVAVESRTWSKMTARCPAYALPEGNWYDFRPEDSDRDREFRTTTSGGLKPSRYLPDFGEE